MIYKFHQFFNITYSSRKYVQIPKSKYQCSGFINNTLNFIRETTIVFSTQPLLILRFIDIYREVKLTERLRVGLSSLY